MWQEDSMAVPTKFTVSIDKSALVVVCEVDVYDPDDSSLLLIRAFQFARGVIDCLAFTWGEGLSIIFDDLVEPSGKSRHIQFSNPNLSKLATVFPVNPNGRQIDFLTMYRMVMNQPEVFLCLNDLILAISVPGHVAVSCARAIEGLRATILPSDETRTRAWEVFRHVLNLEKSYIDYITKASTAGRHGDKYGYQENNAEILERSWIIMNRFFAYMKGGYMPISLLDFPILS